jgi:hypothetical protein
MIKKKLSLLVLTQLTRIWDNPIKKYESTRVNPANSLSMIRDQDNLMKKKKQIMKCKAH